MPSYIPQKGDFITLSFDPPSGHEQKGRRPALVISNDLFNQYTGLAIVCPITNTNRQIPVHLPVAGSSSLTGYMMVDQVTSIDYVARGAKLIGKATNQLLEDVLGVLDVCVK